MFHPLITPLTTYMYTTDIQESGTVSASDQERLPPGGFSLRHGFPDWFGRGRRSMVEAKQAPVTSPVTRQHQQIHHREHLLTCALGKRVSQLMKFYTTSAVPLTQKKFSTRYPSRRQEIQELGTHGERTAKQRGSWWKTQLQRRSRKNKSRASIGQRA
ncbi:hypothetical protein LB505_001027 [Fusarium chuoi]|nr:hypothetical protein LB505_001027 [Fusarium chuoi]